MSKRPDPPDGTTPKSYSDLDRPPVPTARESNTDSAWAQFNALSTEFPATQPGAGFAPTEPAGMAPAGGSAQAPKVGVSLVLAEARKNNRACPHPAAWQALYDMLPNKRDVGGRMEPPPPPLGPAWTATSPMTKRMCLRDHIEWADKHGALEAVHGFLKSLPEEAWLYMR